MVEDGVLGMVSWCSSVACVGQDCGARHQEWVDLEVWSRLF